MGQDAVNSWFRFYNSVPDDPKIGQLSDANFRSWTYLLCVASKNDGLIPDDLKTLGYTLRRPPNKTADIIQVLLSAGLLERCEGGFKPHNWNGRQFKNDVSTERVKRFRERNETVSETPPDQTQIPDSETDGKKASLNGFSTGKKNGDGNGHATIKDPSERIARFQKKLADAFGTSLDGWAIVSAAADPSSSLHQRSLLLCKAKAKEIGKGWPNNWPSEVMQ